MPNLLGITGRQERTTVTETPTRVRFKTLLSEGYSQHAAAKKIGIPRSLAQYFIDRPD
jgi:transposase